MGFGMTKQGTILKLFMNSLIRYVWDCMCFHLCFWRCIYYTGFNQHFSRLDFDTASTLLPFKKLEIFTLLSFH